MTVDDWIDLLKGEESLPHSGRAFHTLTKEKQEMWGIFRDWLEDRDEDRQIYILDAVRRPYRKWGDTGYLRPYQLFSGGYRWLGTKAGWADDTGTRMPVEWWPDGEEWYTGNKVFPCERDYVHSSLAHMWKELFHRAKDPTLPLPPPVETKQ